MDVMTRVVRSVFPCSSYLGEWEEEALPIFVIATGNPSALTKPNIRHFLIRRHNVMLTLHVRAVATAGSAQFGYVIVNVSKTPYRPTSGADWDEDVRLPCIAISVGDSTMTAPLLG